MALALLNIWKNPRPKGPIQINNNTCTITWYRLLTCNSRKQYIITGSGHRVQVLWHHVSRRCKSHTSVLYEIRQIRDCSNDDGASSDFKRSGMAHLRHLYWENGLGWNPCESASRHHVFNNRKSVNMEKHEEKIFGQQYEKKHLGDTTILNKPYWKAVGRSKSCRLLCYYFTITCMTESRKI